MSCHDTRAWFSGWVDETLTVDEQAALTRHLAGCADCRRELSRFRETVALLQRVERPRAPAGFAARVLAAARPVPWGRRLVARLFVPLSVKLPAGAAAAILVAGLALYVVQRTPELQQATRPDAPPPARSLDAPGPPAEMRRVLTPPATVAPSEPRPGRTAEIRRKTEPSSEGEVTRDASGGKLAPPEESGKTEAAPAMRPPPAPAPVAESRKDQGEAGAPAPRPLEPVSMERPAPPAPAAEGRQDAASVRAARTPAPPSLAPRAALSALSAADVRGRLTVKDRDAAESSLIELLTRTGGGVVSRHQEQDATVIHLVVPRASYAQFSLELKRIGAWLPEGEPAELPPDVHVTLRLAR